MYSNIQNVVTSLPVCWSQGAAALELEVETVPDTSDHAVVQAVTVEVVISGEEKLFQIFHSEHKFKYPLKLDL